MYIVTLILEDNGSGPTFWYARLEVALGTVSDFVDQGYSVKIEKAN